MTLMISGGGGGGGATALGGLSDVTLGVLANGQILQYNSGSGQWENTALTGQLTYQGAFDASTGTPALTNALKGDFYVVSVAGTQFGRDWAIGDHLIVNADMGGVIDNAKIDKIDNTDAVSSVNGATGVVNLYADDATLNLAGTGLVTSGAGATSTLNVDVGTTASKIVQLDGSARLPAVDGSQLTNLPTAPVDSVNGATGVVNLYADDATLNLAGTGLVTSGAGATSTLNVDVGTTASKIVQLDGSARLPAVDGSQLTNLPTAPVDSVNGATGVVNLYADDATLNLAGTGLVTSGAGATSTLNVDVGTTASKIVQLDGSARLPAVDGSQLTNLPAAPVDSVNGATGVVNLYADDATLNLAGTGLVTSGAGATSTLNVDVGTTASKVVQLDGSARLPAVDGSQLTNLPAAPVDSVNGATGVVNLYADDATLNLAGTGLVISGTGATSTLNADVGTGANQLVQLDGSSRLPAVDGSQLTNVLHDVVDDTTPQLGGDLDVQARIITTSTANGSISLEPDGTGSVVARGTGVGLTAGTVTLNCEQNSHGVALQSPPHSAAASYTLKLPTSVGTVGQLLTTDGNNPAQLSWSTASGGGSRPGVYTQSASFTIGDGTGTDPGAVTAAELERVYLINNGGSAVTVTLPAIGGNVGAGLKFNIKMLGTANVTIDRNGANIDDSAANQTLSVQYSSYTLCCAGASGWYII